MPSVRFRTVGRAAVLLGCLAMLLPAGSASGLAQEQTETPDLAADSCPDGWREVPVPDEVAGSRPYDIVSVDGRPAWLLGGSNDGAVALRWRNDRWVRVDTDLSGTASLVAGAPSGGSSIWAVGNARPIAPRRMEPLAGQLRGGGWQARTIKGVPGDRVALTGVTRKGNDRAWAVGTRLTRGQTKAYALRWNGTRWQRREPAAGKGESGLAAVTTTPNGDVWTVGWRHDADGTPRPLIANATPSGWDVMRGAPLPAGIAALTDVAFRDAREGWAIGYLIEAGSSVHRPILQRWDGSSWSLEALPWGEGRSAIPHEIELGPDGDLWIVGTALPSDRPTTAAFVAHRQAGAWQIDEDLLPAERSSELFSIALIDGRPMIAGVVGAPDDIVATLAVVMVACDGSDGGDGAGAGAVDPLDGASASPDGASASLDGASASRSTARARSLGRSTARLAGKLALDRPRKPKGFVIRDVAEQAGIALAVPNISGLARDLDQDGWTDVLFWNHFDQPGYFLGGPDGFHEGPGQVFGASDRHDCDVADVDADGRLDTFCVSGRRRGGSIGRHELSLATGFEDGSPSADLLGAEDAFGRGRSTTFINLDDDLPDLFVTNQPDRGDGMPGMNRFYRNVAGRLVPDPGVGLDRSVGGSCATAADIDADGDEDLLLCTDYSNDGRREGLRVYRNEDGVLRERSRKLGLEPFGDIAVLSVDMSGDGRPDLLQLSGQRLRISRGTRNGFKPLYEVVIPSATGMATGDVDGDGAEDIYVVTGSAGRNDPDVLLVNEGRGKSFRSVRIPQATDGSGTAVMSLDHDHNGLDDFLVLNGGGRLDGTIQLLASFPSTSG